MEKSIKAFISIAAVAIASALTSCDSMIYDDQGDCSVHYRLPITFTTNILDANAFASQVSNVTVYVYDDHGNLALVKKESGNALRNPGYAMDLELLPGKYSMLAWCEGNAMAENPTMFSIGGGDRPASISDLSATLPLNGTAGELYSNKNIVPLFHGYLSDVECADTYGTITLPVLNLMKDTNIINVIAENLEGTEIEPDALTVSIEASNSEMNWKNEVVGDEAFKYTPWSVTPLSSEKDTKADSTDPMTGLLAELTVGRLMVDRKPILVIHRKNDNTDIVRLDLIKYLCMVKGHYSGNYSDQEYLDRMDFHSITFFVDADLNWYTAAGLNINGWKVVPDQNIEL